MSRAILLHVYAMLAVCLSIALPSNVSAQTGHSDVQAAFDALNSWLAESEHASGWKTYLQAEDLAAQLKKGDQADPDALQQQLDLYSGSNSGLRKSHFTDVRDALDGWIAELTLPPQDELAGQAVEAVKELEPIDAEKLTQAKERLNAAAKSFESYLQRGGQAKVDGWKRFLLWDDFSAELAEEDTNLDSLVRTWALLASDSPGLTYREFSQLREAIRNYLELAEYFADEENALTNLPARLQAFQKQQNEETVSELGLTLAWLEREHDASELVQGIRRHYAKPNLYVEVSEALAVYGFADKVEQTDPISNYSNGNSTSGTGHTVADVTASLSPNGSRGQITVNMEGTINSTTRTNNSQGVSFNTTGVTSVDANKEVFFASQGLIGQRAKAHCVTDNTTSNIRATSAQVESIARQRIAERERSSELEAARRSEQRVESDLNKRVDEQVKDANERLQRDFYAPMSRRGVEPRFIAYNSTTESLQQRMILAAPEHLAAPNNPPELKANGDVIARAHASWVNNLADISLRGALLTDVALADAIEEWRGEVPEELKITDDSEPWDITYASRRPLWLECEKDQIRITLRGQRFTARDRVMNEAMHISATYKVKRDGGMISLVRDGEVEVSFPEQGEKLSVRYVSMRRFWQTKFSSLFTKEFKDLNLNLRGAWQAAGPLKLTALGVHPDGWVGLAWKMPPAAEEK